MASVAARMASSYWPLPFNSLDLAARSSAAPGAADGGAGAAIRVAPGSLLAAVATSRGVGVGVHSGRGFEGLGGHGGLPPGWAMTAACAPHQSNAATATAKVTTNFSRDATRSIQASLTAGR